MSRSAVPLDPTRFTSTTPHASTPSLPKKTGPAGETPLEKVKRLRAAANAAREAQVTPMDKIILRGRVWADRLHKFTALSLIGFTVLAGGVTIYALGDMMVYNRTKKAQYFAEKKRIEDEAVAEARSAIQAGTADQRQIDYIVLRDAEDARIAWYLNKKNEKKGFYRATKEFLIEFIFLGLKKQEYDVSIHNFMKEPSEEADGEVDKGGEIMKALEDKQNGVSEQAKKAFANEKERQRKGGALDRLGTSEGSGDEQPKSGGWMSFMIRNNLNK